MSAASIESISVKCPKTKKLAKVVFDPSSIHVKSDPCNFCGSHGTMHYKYTCPICDKEHATVVYDW